MDRREAIKKLAVGAAIAAGGSLVLSSDLVTRRSAGPADRRHSRPGRSPSPIYFPPRPDGNNDGKRIVLGVGAADVGGENGPQRPSGTGGTSVRSTSRTRRVPYCKLRSGATTPTGPVIAQAPDRHPGARHELPDRVDHPHGRQTAEEGRLQDRGGDRGPGRNRPVPPGPLHLRGRREPARSNRSSSTGRSSPVTQRGEADQRVVSLSRRTAA